MRPAIQAKYGLLGGKEAAQAVLDGTIDLNDIMDEVKKMS